MQAAPVSMLGLATAVPAHVLKQNEVATFARRVFRENFARQPKLAEVFTNAGIERRHSVKPLEWFETPHDWTERTQAYLSGAGALFVEAATKALRNAMLTAKDVDVIVTVSSTGIATPSLEARVGAQMGFRPSASRVPVFGLGCAGGVSGLSIGARLARAVPGEVVLVVAIELCTLAFRPDRNNKADVISAALFGDGAAAVVLRAEKESNAVQIVATAEHTWPGTLDIMGWSVDPIGFGVVLSRSLPGFVKQHVAAPMRRFIEAARIEKPQYVFHPGGARVLDALQAALKLKKSALQDERAVLRDYGNMSGPSVLFVLARALERGLKDTAILSALGPGFTASLIELRAGQGVANG